MYKNIKVAVSVFVCFFCRGLAHYFVSVCPTKEGTGDRDVNMLMLGRYCIISLQPKPIVK